MNLALDWSQRYGPIPDAIEQPGPQGDAARSVGQQAYKIIVDGMCCGGLNFGYYYDGSPIVGPRRRDAAQLHTV
jgi:hypothetical protein